VELTSKVLTDVETATVGEIAEPGFVFAKAFCCSEMLGIEETVPLLDVLDLGLSTRCWWYTARKSHQGSPTHCASIQI